MAAFTNDHDSLYKIVASVHVLSRCDMVEIVREVWRFLVTWLIDRPCRCRELVLLWRQQSDGPAFEYVSDGRRLFLRMVFMAIPVLVVPVYPQTKEPNDKGRQDRFEGHEQ